MDQSAWKVLMDLIHKGFGDKWIHWISLILVSGTSQGDPLYPLLFVLAADLLHGLTLSGWFPEWRLEMEKLLSFGIIVGMCLFQSEITSPLEVRNYYHYDVPNLKKKISIWLLHLGLSTLIFCDGNDE
ncbi:hypothetical protein ACJX0J_007293, partial [Zea mays]